MKTVYGIDFSPSGSAIVRARRGGGRTRLEPATEIPPGAVVAAGLAVHETFARRLTAPLASVEKARRVLPSLLDVQLPFPLEKCIFVFPEIAAVGGQVEALAVAARAEDVAAALGRLAEVGHDPHVLDHEALALWTQSLAEAPPSGPELRAVLYAGRDRSALVLGRGRRFLAASGSRSATPDPQRMNQFLRAQLREEADAPFAWAVVGPGAGDALRASLNRPEDTIFIRHADPADFLARALAARAVKPGPLACNLRTGPAEHPGVAAARAAARARAARLCLAASLALGLLDLGWMAHLRRRDAAAQSALTAAAVEVAGIKNVPKGQELMIAQRALAERAPRLAPFASLLAPPLTERLTSLLALAGRNGVSFSSLVIRRDGMELSGHAPTWEAAGALVEPLAPTGWRLDLQRGEAGADERVPFTLKGAP